ncbi:MAG: hypothetical protein ACLPWO_05395 [Thermoplasmata archaeon]
MTSPRTLRVAALVALAVTSVFWFWVSAGLIAVHWPNNGNGVLAVALIAAGIVILGYALLSTTLSLAARSDRALALPVLEGVSVASLLVIASVGALLVSSSPLSDIASLPIGAFVLPPLGLGGSAASAILYDLARRRDRAMRGRSRPSVPEGAGSPV